MAANGTPSHSEEDCGPEERLKQQEFCDGHLADNDGSLGLARPTSSEDSDMADVPFEQLAALRAGTMMAGANRMQALKTSGRHQQLRKRQRPAQHRENKNRPAEASSRRPAARLRDVLQGPKIERKDPRFEVLSGTYNSDAFRKRYSFMFEETLPAESSFLKAKLRKTKRSDVKEQLTAQSARVEAALREDLAQQKKRKFEADLKAKEKAPVKAGKKPFFLKAADKRKAELVAKYEELRNAGKLEKFLAKRRRKNAAKDHRYVPDARRT